MRRRKTKWSALTSTQKVAALRHLVQRRSDASLELADGLASIKSAADQAVRGGQVKRSEWFRGQFGKDIQDLEDLCERRLDLKIDVAHWLLRVWSTIRRLNLNWESAKLIGIERLSLLGQVVHDIMIDAGVHQKALRDTQRLCYADLRQRFTKRFSKQLCRFDFMVPRGLAPSFESVLRLYMDPLISHRRGRYARTAALARMLIEAGAMRACKEEEDDVAFRSLQLILDSFGGWLIWARQGGSLILQSKYAPGLTIHEEALDQETSSDDTYEVSSAPDHSTGVLPC